MFDNETQYAPQHVSDIVSREIGPTPVGRPVAEVRPDGYLLLNEHVILACLIAAAGLVYAGLASGVIAVLVALSLVNIGISSAKPPLWSMPTLFLSGPAAAAGIADAFFRYLTLGTLRPEGA